MNTSQSLRNRILDLVRREPGLRTVQIVDRLDEDFSLVDEELLLMAKGQELQGHDVVAPSGRNATAWTLRGIASWQVPGAVIAADAAPTADKVQSDSDVAHAVPELAQPTGISIPGAVFPTSSLPLPAAPIQEQDCAAPLAETQEPAKERRAFGMLLMQALGLLRQQELVSTAELKKAMGIEYHPSIALRRALQKGWIAKVGRSWTLGAVVMEQVGIELRPAVGDAATAAPASEVENLVLHGVSADLTSVEYIGFLKGSAKFHSLCAKHQGDFHSFQASMFLRLLSSMHAEK